MDYPAQQGTTPAAEAKAARRRALHVPRPHVPRLRVPFRGGGGPEQEPEKTMTLVEHLVELRRRIFISIFALVPGTLIGFAFSDQIIHVLKAPLPTDRPLTALGLTEPFMIHLQVALVAGFILAMPVVLYQLWAFISPGLTPTERAAARPWVPLALVFFAIGVGVAYLILPYAAAFLFGFQTADVQLLLTADAYFGFITILFLAFGLVMEFPIVLVLLAKVGIVSSERLRRSRRMAILAITVISAVITPGADIVSPTAMGVTMYLLYEVSIFLIRMNGR